MPAVIRWDEGVSSYAFKRLFAFCGLHFLLGLQSRDLQMLVTNHPSCPCDVWVFCIHVFALGLSGRGTKVKWLSGACSNCQKHRSKGSSSDFKFWHMFLCSPHSLPDLSSAFEAWRKHHRAVYNVQKVTSCFIHKI